MTEIRQDEFTHFANRVQALLGIDLRSYRPEQMLRRLQQFCQRHRAAGLSDLGRRLAGDPALTAELRDFLTINVTEFFRNTELFERLRTQVLPAIAAPAPRIWSAGCSTGAEAYSLAMLALEAGRTATHIWATDIDPAALAQAESGTYGATELRGVSPLRLRRFFSACGERWQVRPELRRLVRVSRHDLLQDPVPPGWDLILCRNVVIYFTEGARAALYRRLCGALRPGGVLFVGGTESIPGAEALGLQMIAPFFYRRRTLQGAG